MPINVGIIGLSASPTSWAANAHATSLLKEPLSTQYKLTAIATSSPESVSKSAQKWNIDPSKAYVGAEDIAKDSDIDLAVVSVKLPMHRDLALPALKAGKDVFVEWPLATTLEQVEEFIQAAKMGGGKTFVGLQARTSPTILRAKEIIDSNTLGRIISSTITGWDNYLLSLPAEYDYEHFASNRADVTTITSGHVLDAQAFLLGEYEYLSAQNNCFFPTFTTPLREGNIIRDAPDSLLVQGKLLSGATASFSMILTPPGPPSSFTWTIFGEKGALKFEGGNINIQMVAPKLYLSSAEEEGWQEVEVPAPKTGNHTGDLYLAIAEGGKNGAVVDFEGARLRHEMLEACVRSSKEGRRVRYL